MLCIWENLQFNALSLFVSERQVNPSRPSKGPAHDYVAMALHVAESLAKAGKSLRVFRNDPQRASSLAGADAGRITLEELELGSSLSESLNFYAADHKLHLFSRFAEEIWH